MWCRAARAALCYAGHLLVITKIVEFLLAGVGGGGGDGLCAEGRAITPEALLNMKVRG